MQLIQYGERLTEKRNKVVIDTGILISAFIFGGIPEKALKKAFSEADIYVSENLLKEYRDVPLELMTKGKIDHIQLKALISGIAAFVTRIRVILPDKKLAICRDTEDNMILECCLKAGADFLITGDKDLLEIKDLPFQLKILSPRKYLEEG